MRSRRCIPLCALAFSVFFAASCSEFEDVDMLFPRIVDVDILNDSSVAAHIMAPEETASADNLVQPGGGRIASVRFESGGNVSFRAINEQGLFILSTWKFGRTSTVSGEVVLTEAPALLCRGELFADN